ncbi:MAG: hypothetical protein JSR77_00940 [Planctomycetes bacterium]|nr:hypothetical protein [Planctomycetota bacterium]
MTRLTRPQLSRNTALCLLAGLALVAGCERRSDNAKNIQKNAGQMRAIGVATSADGAVIPEGEYKKVASNLATAASSGTAGEKSAASSLIAQSLLAQGEAAASRAKDAELAARNLISRIGSAAADFAKRSAVAAAAEAFNASKDQAAIRTGKAEKETELAAERKHLETVRNAVDALSSQAKAKLDAADAKTAQYAQMIQGTTKLSATEASAIYEKANVIRREGDSLRAEGLKIKAHADEQNPLVGEIGLIIDKLQKQIANLDETAESLKKREAAAKAEAADARSAADKAAREVDDRVVELSKLREGELEKAYAEAIDLFGKATKSSKAVDPNSANASAGAADLSMAETQWSKAQGARAYAAAMETLANIKPKINNADDYKNKSDGAKKQTEEAIKAATESFAAAKLSYEKSVNKVQRADIKERLTKLGEELDKKAKNVVDGIWLDLQAKPEPAPVAAAPAGDSAPAPAAAAAAPADPALVEFIGKYINLIKAQDFDGVLAATHFASPGTRETMARMTEIQKAFFAADKACQTKFNMGLDKIASGNPMLTAMAAQLGAARGMISAISNASPADIKLTMNGADKASGTFPGMPQATDFIKAEGAWQIDGAAMEGMAGQLAMVSKQLGTLKGVFATFADDVNAGKFPDSNAAAADLGAKIIGAMQGGMKPPGGG